MNNTHTPIEDVTERGHLSEYFVDRGVWDRPARGGVYRFVCREHTSRRCAGGFTARYDLVCYARRRWQVFRSPVCCYNTHISDTDVTRALGEAIDIVTRGKHDRQQAHERIRLMYNWGDVAERTDKIYAWVLAREPRSFWERLCR